MYASVYMQDEEVDENSLRLLITYHYFEYKLC